MQYDNNLNPCYLYFSEAVLNGGETNMTPSPRTNNISIVLFDVWN